MRDGNIRGFEGIDKDGSENPFTFGKVDDSHEDDSKVSEFGLGFKVDSYRVGVGYINGDETFPLSNTFQLTINVEI